MRGPVLLFIAVIALGAPGCTRSLDTQSLEEQIASQVREEGGPSLDEVECPDDIEVAAGGTFECSATGDGVGWTVRVVQLDDDGNVEFDIVPSG